jgi:hypothetical protein
MERNKQLHNQQVADLTRWGEAMRTELEREFEGKRRELVQMDEEILLQSFGFYKPRYDLLNSDAYKARLEKIRAEQEIMVKTGTAASGSTSWTVNNSRKEGERMVKDNVKLILRSFNNECDASIINVKFNNIESIEKRIRKAFETLNKLGTQMTITISPTYFELKLQELYLCHEYQIKKQQEKEEQKLLREKMREEAKALREIEEMKLKLGKEENALHKAFEGRRLNLINRRREFFHVSLEEIKQVVTTNFSKPVEFVELADAAEYRQSTALKQNDTPMTKKPAQTRAPLLTMR